MMSEGYIGPNNVLKLVSLGMTELRSANMDGESKLKILMDAIEELIPELDMFEVNLEDIPLMVDQLYNIDKWKYKVKRCCLCRFLCCCCSKRK